MASDLFGVARVPPKFEADGLALDPSQLLHPLAERRDAPLRHLVGLRRTDQNSDPPNAVNTLLRPRSERPRRRRAAEQRDELAPPDHSITSSARASSLSGVWRPSALAVS